MNLEVHIDWQRQTHLVGRLYPADRSSAVTFEYAREWLEYPGRFAIDPTSLPLQSSPLHSATLFGAISDCGPDRWGRVLIERAARKKILAAKPYRDIDYVLALDDFSRIGALRFRMDGEFLAVGSGRLPPVVQLGALIHAADAIHNETETAQDLRFLLGEGSPLGGARPKSAVQLPGGELAIAKFSKPDDIRNIAAGEILALELARLSGINTAAHQLVRVKNRSVAVITRFDRKDTARIPFISAASLLALPPTETGSYAHIAEAIRQLGDNVVPDLKELWRRLVFSLLASNYDDHLRNHGFLMTNPGRWALAPAYDLNPVPEIDRAQTNKTSISEANEEPSIDEAMNASARFALKLPEAKGILQDVLTTVTAWREAGRKLRLKASTLDAYQTAFENPLTEEAARLLGRRKGRKR
jgi:serine/threonine-protein kinase HipA